MIQIYTHKLTVTGACISNEETKSIETEFTVCTLSYETEFPEYLHSSNFHARVDEITEWCKSTFGPEEVDEHVIWIKSGLNSFMFANPHHASLLILTHNGT